MPRPSRWRRVCRGIPVAVAACVLALPTGAFGSTAPHRALSKKTASSPPTTTTTPAAGPTITLPTSPATSALPWKVLSTDAAGVAEEETTITVPSGRQVTLAWFGKGSVRFDLHVGSADPPTDLAALPPNSGPMVGAGEAATLLGAFNGGFKMNAGVGGMEVQGDVVAPLTNGFASLVIDTDGTAHVGVWGSQVPGPGEQVASVRQNLPPLIMSGVANATVGTPAAWGATVNSSMVVARSAVGEDAAGDILFAGGSALLPRDLSDALLATGAVNAMQLDINPAWVQLDAAAGAGGPLSALIPGQTPAADQYRVGWSRDFVTAVTTRVVEPNHFRPAP